jgi:hypothetical protein
MEAEKAQAAATLGASVINVSTEEFWLDKADQDIAFRVGAAPSPAPSIIGSYREVLQSPVPDRVKPEPRQHQERNVLHKADQDIAFGVGAAPSPAPSIIGSYREVLRSPVSDRVKQEPRPLQDRNVLHSSGSNRFKSETRREVVPNKYDGKASWREYFIHFQACQRLNRWEEDDAAQWLATRLEGEALAVLVPGERYTYAELVGKLEERFGRGLSTENYLIELRARKRQPKESLPELGQAVRQLAALAYPDLTVGTRERLAKEHFKDAVNDTELRAAIFRAKPGNLNDAISAALETECFLKAEQARKPNRPPYTRVLEGVSAGLEQRMEKLEQALMTLLKEGTQERRRKLTSQEWQELQQREKEAECYYCKKRGHYRRNCLAWKQNPENRSVPPQRAMGRPDTRQVQSLPAGPASQPPQSQ